MDKKLDHETLNNSTLSMSIIQWQKECRIEQRVVYTSTWEIDDQMSWLIGDKRSKMEA